MLRGALRVAVLGAAVAAWGAACGEALTLDDGPGAADAGPVEGGNAEGAVVDARPERFCSTVDAGFCWSFDDNAGGGFERGPFLTWLTPFGDGGAGLSEAAVSPPHALRVEIRGIDGELAEQGVDYQFRSADRTSVRCGATVVIDETTQHAVALFWLRAEPVVATIELRGAPEGFEAHLVAQGRLPDGTIVGRTGLIRNVRLGERFRASLGATIVDGGTRLVGRVNEAELALSVDGISAGDARMAFALISKLNAAAWVARFDDLTCDPQ
jgi:hypothetical protein